jgi:hypothetical protein
MNKTFTKAIIIIFIIMIIVAMVIPFALLK